MITPEKNDVVIDKLFNWGKSYTIVLPDNTQLTLYVRVVSDEEFNRARVYALRKAREYRDKLLDKKTDEHKAFMVDPSKIKKEELVNLILMLEMPIIYRQAEREVNLPFPKEPEVDAPTSEWVKYQEEIDEYPSKLTELITEKVTQLTRERRKELESLPKKRLEFYYTNKVLDKVLTEKLEKEFLKACAFFGTYRDKDYTKPLFRSIEDLDKLPSKIQEAIINSYLEVDIPMEELKKLHEATL